MPAPSVARLPVYRRALDALLAEGATTVSSAELAGLTGVNAATVRRDLSWLGSYGTPGTGYDPGQLLDRMDRELALDREWPIVVVGVGNLGRALAGSGTFASRGFKVAALVDVDPAVVGTTVGGIKVDHVRDLAGVVRRHRIAFAVLATPPQVAQATATELAEAGARAILNFAPVRLHLPPSVRVRNVDLAAELQVLAFYGARASASGGAGAGRARRSPKKAGTDTAGGAGGGRRARRGAGADGDGGSTNVSPDGEARRGRRPGRPVA